MKCKRCAFYCPRRVACVDMFRGECCCPWSLHRMARSRWLMLKQNADSQGTTGQLCAFLFPPRSRMIRLAPQHPATSTVSELSSTAPHFL